MTPAMHGSMSPTPYIPRSDVMDRHDWAINKSRKPASTGGGRAWSEEEEAYLIQTRMQKMPYKHIAAHLKKTELACRLHYHQLSHGSNRRRMNSVSSSSSSVGHSPIIMPGTMPSPIRESPGRSVSPAGSLYTTSHHSGIHLPSISSSNSSNSNNNNNANSSPRLPALLPKPTSRMSLPPMERSPPSAAPLLPSATFTRDTHTYISAPSRTANSTPLSLRLDCSMLPPPSSLHNGGNSNSHTTTTTATSSSAPIDLTRLQHIYNSHRATFWSAIAAEYGNHVHPTVLEDAWTSSTAYSSSSSSSLSSSSSISLHMHQHQQQPQFQHQHQHSHQHRHHHPMMAQPPRNVVTPPAEKSQHMGGDVRNNGGMMYCAAQTATPISPESGSPIAFESAVSAMNKGDRTRISAILGD